MDVDREVDPSKSTARNVSKLFILAILFLIDTCIDDFIEGETAFILGDSLPFKVYPIMAAMLIPFWGFFADVYGRQRTLALSSAAVAILLFVQVFIPSEFETLNIILKIFTGLFKAHCIVGKVLTTELFTDEWKPVVLSTAFAF